MDLSVARKMPLGNGILTTENEAQAIERADRARLDKGGDAARAALAMYPPETGGALMAAENRSAARLAAVQALYQMEVAGKGLNEILAEFETWWIGQEVEGDQYKPAEIAFFRSIVSGVVENQVEIDRAVDKTLSDGWPLRRIEALMRAILRAGAFELLQARRHSRARGDQGICRRRRRLFRPRGSRHDQRRARRPGAKKPRRGIFGLTRSFMRITRERERAIATSMRGVAPRPGRALWTKPN